MEGSDVILCTACFASVKETQDILMCSGCKLWQHRTCASEEQPLRLGMMRKYYRGLSEPADSTARGQSVSTMMQGTGATTNGHPNSDPVAIYVDVSFYRDFYIAVVRGDKPRQWMCGYCSKNISIVKSEPDIPTNPSTADDQSDDEDYSFDEIALAEECQRENGEALASLDSSFSIPISSPTKSVTSATGKEIPVSSRLDDTVWTGSATSSVTNLTYQVDHSEMTEFSANQSLHNPAWCDDSMSDDDSDDDLNITPAALRLPDNPPAPKYTFKRIYATSTAVNSLESLAPREMSYTRDADTQDKSDSDDEMSPLNPLSDASTIPYCHSDSSLSDSSIEFPPPKRISLAPPPTQENSVNRDNTIAQDGSSSSSSDSEGDRPIRERPYSSDSCDSSDDDQHFDNRVPPFRWSASSSSESSDSEDETDLKRPPTVTFQLTQGPISGGQSLLQDSRGYTYSIKFRIGVNTFWCCTDRSTRCQATAIQNRNMITEGAATHNHPAKIPGNSPELEVEEPPKDRFPRLKPDQDKPAGQPPKPQVEILNIGVTEESQVLIDSNGFVYNEKEFSLEARQTTWRCSKKTKKGICTGAIRVGRFLVAKIHNHPGDHKKVTELRIRSKVKSWLEKNPTLTPAQLINTILGDMYLQKKSITKASYQALTKHIRKQKQALK